MGCSTLFKYIIFLVNFVIVVVSLALIGIGVYIELKMKKYFEFFSVPMISVPIILMVVGGIILVVSFLGCCGAITNNKCMMLTYATILGLFTLILVAFIVLVIVFKVRILFNIKKLV